MNPTVHVDPRPEAMADVPGVCEVPLTRAVVQYRDVHEVGFAGGRIQDIGLALVLEGRFASSSECLDLGSGDIKLLDLSSELVVLDWAYEPTLEHALSLVRRAATSGDRSGLERFAFRVGLQVLERLGFGPLTRPTLLRIGFRDVCRDLDLHEGTSVRIVMGPGRLVRAHMDYDGNAMLFRTPTADADPDLEATLADAFPGAELRRIVPASSAASGGYVIRFTLPRTLDELQELIERVRDGLAHVLGRFEPSRRRGAESLWRTFGPRDTLARLRGEPAADSHAEVAPRDGPLSEPPGSFGSGRVH